MQKRCMRSGVVFTVTPEDLAYYEKIAPRIGEYTATIPTPSLCPDERQRRRIAFRNERKLYHRKCDLTGREIISMYSPDKQYVVYDQKEWWGDRWDGTTYGRGFDFTKSFFSQSEALRRVVPRVSLINHNSVNSEYTNISADNKNCYLIIESSNNDECYYGHWLQKCTQCVDCAFCYECTLCYESSDCRGCYDLRYSKNCRGCSESAFLESCTDCKNCFGCINLRQKQYYIFNKPYSAREYHALIAQFSLSKHSSILERRREVLEHFALHPRKYSQILNSEECSGCYIADSQGCYSCYHAVEAKDCRYGVHVWRNAKDCMDVDTAGRDAELIFESINSGIGVYHNLFCMTCWSASDLLYCDLCPSSKHCFGCIGLKHSEYCILNKQYTKSEYETLMPKIIEHMRKTGEWGEFFPAESSCFGYNESAAQDSFPMTKAEANARSYKWHDDDASAQYQGRQYTIADDITQVGEDITKAILKCTATGRPYRVIPQELSFYQKQGIPVPQICSDRRHSDRMAQRLPRQVWERTCSACHKTVSSPYSPERTEKIVCEACYAEIIE